MFPIHAQNSSHSRPVITQGLIWLNSLVYLLTWWLKHNDVTWVFAGYGMVPSRLTADLPGESWKVFSSMFLHADIMHLLWNMLFLYIFGKNIEDALGKGKYLFFYCVAGVAGGLGQYLVGPDSTIPLIGASGAIAGVLAGYLVLYPKAPVTLVNPIILLWLVMGPFFVLPAWMAVTWWFVGNLMGGLSSLGGAETQTAFFAHLGGFAAGLVIIRPLFNSSHDDSSSNYPGSSQRHVARTSIFHKEQDAPFWHK